MKTLQPGGLAYRLIYSVAFVGTLLARLANCLTGYHPRTGDEREKTDR